MSARPSAADNVTLAATGWTKQQRIGSLAEPDITGGKCHDVSLAEHWHGIEVETIERFVRRQTGFGEMSLDPVPGALGDFEFDERREEAYCEPALFIGPGDDVPPEAVDGGLPQFVQQ